MSDKIDEYHWHEALDRLHLAQAFIDDNLYSHPVFQAHPKLLAKLDKALMLLGDLYQDVGKKHFK